MRLLFMADKSPQAETVSQYLKTMFPGYLCTDNLFAGDNTICQIHDAIPEYADEWTDNSFVILSCQKEIPKDISDKAIGVMYAVDPVDLSSLPLMQYHELFKLFGILSSVRASLFTFGSTGRGTMKKTSDVDVFLLCDASQTAIYGMLEPYFESVRIMDNEFIIRENGVLMEMNLIRNVSEAYLFYNRSLITNPEKTILKDDYGILTSLQKAAAEVFDREKEIAFTIERLLYYVQSLPTLIEKGDEYKYFFHNNIVVHEYVRLKAFWAGIFDFSYLPLQAKQYLTDDEWAQILYSFGQDQVEHYHAVKCLAEEIISKVSKLTF